MNIFFISEFKEADTISKQKMRQIQIKSKSFQILKKMGNQRSRGFKSGQPPTTFFSNPSDFGRNSPIQTPKKNEEEEVLNIHIYSRKKPNKERNLIVNLMLWLFYLCVLCVCGASRRIEFPSLSLSLVRRHFLFRLASVSHARSLRCCVCCSFLTWVKDKMTKKKNEYNKKKKSNFQTPPPYHYSTFHPIQKKNQ
jgi:hypothetical protein